MYKFKEFFGNLSKSTRLTVISCGIFIILTFIILMFFVMFPITPSEKVISGMGRAGLMDSDGKNSPYGDELNGVVVTTSADSSGKKNDSKVTTANTQVTYPKVHYVDKIFTTNEGYVYTGYAVPTGQPGYNSYNYNSNQSLMNPNPNSRKLLKLMNPPNRLHRNIQNLMCLILHMMNRTFPK